MSTFLGRNIIESKTFEKDPFHETIGWLHERGYDFGDKNNNDNIPVMKGYYDRYEIPRKWELLDKRQKNFVHGVITGDRKKGPITVYLVK